MHRVHRGVYSVGHQLITLRGRWTAAVLAGGADAALSHTSAAALWDLCRQPPGPIDITVSAKSGRRSKAGLRVHRAVLHPHDRTHHDGIPVTSIPRTLLDMAALGDPRRLLAEAERQELLDVSALTALLDRSNGHRGTGRLRALLRTDLAADSRADSELEHLFLELMRGAKIPAPRTNALVEGFLVDAYWPEARLIVELDGYAFHRDREAFERDRARDARLKRAGYEVVRFTWRQLRDEPEAVVATVWAMLSRGAFAYAA